MPRRQPAVPERTLRRPPLWLFGLAGALVLGAVLRLVCVHDIEYKADEHWIVLHARYAPDAMPLDWVGIPASIGIRNPAMGTWVFRALSLISRAQTPIQFARAVQIINVGTLVLLACFALWIVPRDQRETWLWAVALGSLNPLAVIFQRKIWPPSVLPLFVLTLLIGWWHRERRWGSFLWGVVGAVIGQVHMAGFFFTAGLAAWAALFERRRVAWRSWFAGNCLGALPMLPWAYTVLFRSHHHLNHAVQWVHVVEMKFWMRWFTEPFGLGVDYSLENDFADFLGYPLLGRDRSYLAAWLYASLLVIAAVVVGRALFWLARNRARVNEFIVGRNSQTAFTQNAALWGFGILLSLSTASIHRHYMIVAFPLTFVWLARVALAPGEKSAVEMRRSRGLLTALCVLQLLVSSCFLNYIHANPHQIWGDYGIPYRAQTKAPIILEFDAPNR